MRTGLEELRAANPSDVINEDTDQYMTRIVAGQLLTGMRLFSCRDAYGICSRFQVLGWVGFS